MATAIGRYAASLGIDTSACGDDIAGRWAALLAAGVANPGLAFARWLDLALVGGVVPPLLANSADVGTLLATLARFHPLWGDDAVVVTPRRDGGAVVTLRPPAGGALHPETFDAFAALLCRLLAQLTSPAVRPSRLVRRAGPVPALDGVADEVVCGASDDRLELPAAALAAPIALADPTVAAVLVGFAEASAAGREAPWAEQVRTEVRRSPGRPVALGEVAARLAVSPRTLQERLRTEGTTFAGIVDAERQAFALGLLRNPDAAVSTVAIAAGFDSVEGFTRAVRRWTGGTPTEWRAGGPRSPFT